MFSLPLFILESGKPKYSTSQSLIAGEGAFIMVLCNGVQTEIPGERSLSPSFSYRCTCTEEKQFSFCPLFYSLLLSWNKHSP